MMAQPLISSAPRTSTDAMETLRPGKQWVCFNPDKEPFDPQNGKPAKANDQSTWGTHEQAQARVTLSSGKFIGTGREFLKEQGITGIDLDHCIDEQSNLSAFAQDVVTRLNSYTEFSPSGTGLHIWVYGSIPENVAPCKPQPDGIEMYDCKRYFTVTDKHFPGTPTTIEHRQEQLTELYDEIQARRKAAKQKRKPPTSRPASSPSIGGDSPYGLKALKEECDQVARTGEGARNDQLNRSAYAMGQLIAGGELNRLTVERELSAAADRAGLGDREIEKTMRSGLEDGMKEPRSAPVKERTYEYKPSRHTTSAASNGNGNGNGGTGTAQVAGGNALPEVIIAGQLREYTAAAVEALRLAEQHERTLFVQSARLVKIGHDEKKRPIILHIGVAELRNALTRSANYYRLKEKADDWIPVEIAPPKDLAEAILGLNPQEWPFPALEAIVETPVLRPDGTILDTPGYDAATRLYYMPSSNMQACKVPAQPTQHDVDQALALIMDAIGEFPYTGDADKANAIALLMTPIVRPAIKRHIPLALIDAPKAGTGKGLLADTVAIIATGGSASNLTAPDDEDEWDKRITAMLLQGRSIICIDNIAGILRSAALDSTLTSDEKEGRVLGFSRMVKVANRATWLATGNNTKLGGDLARRCYRIRLDPHVSRPWMRKGFKHEDLATWVLEHRAELIGAILTLARAWFLAGKPYDPTVPALGTFTNWSRMLGGILSFIGVPGFLSNLEKLYQEADEDSAQWEAFLQAWHVCYSNSWVSSPQLVEKMNSDEGNNTLATTLPEALQFALKDKPSSFAIRLGKQLEKRIDTCYGDANFRIERSQDKHTKGKLWRVHADSAPHNYPQNEPASEADLQPFADSADSDITLARSENSTIHSDSNKKSYIESGGEYYPHYPQSETPDDQQTGSAGATNTHSNDEESENTLSASSTLSAIDDQLTRVGQVIAGLSKVHWMARKSGFASAMVTPQEYLRRLGACLESGDPKRVESAQEEMKRHVER